METFLNLMKSVRRVNTVITNLTYTDTKSVDFTGADCLQPMSSDIQELAQKE